MYNKDVSYVIYVRVYTCILPLNTAVLLQLVLKRYCSSTTRPGHVMGRTKWNLPAFCWTLTA